jgi:hypothetical protein
MIAPYTAENAGPGIGTGLFALGVQASEESALSAAATFCGWQEDGAGGRFQLWTLKLPIPGHPAGSTVSRDSILAYLFPANPGALAGKYGATPNVGDLSDLEAAEGKEAGSE